MRRMMRAGSTILPFLTLSTWHFQDDRLRAAGKVDLCLRFEVVDHVICVLRSPTADISSEGLLDILLELAVDEHAPASIAVAFNKLFNF